MPLCTLNRNKSIKRIFVLLSAMLYIGHGQVFYLYILVKYRGREGGY